MAADIVHLAKGDAWLDTRRGFTAHQGYKAGSANRSPTSTVPAWRTIVSMGNGPGCRGCMHFGRPGDIGQCSGAQAGHTLICNMAGS
eukprot:1154915-Pelagomonas_calceolata.AAC.3